MIIIVNFIFIHCFLFSQPGIRTNTTVCLGKIACHLPEAVSSLVE